MKRETKIESFTNLINNHSNIECSGWREELLNALYQHKVISWDELSALSDLEER